MDVSKTWQEQVLENGIAETGRRQPVLFSWTVGDTRIKPPFLFGQDAYAGRPAFAWTWKY